MELLLLLLACQTDGPKVTDDAELPPSNTAVNEGTPLAPGETARVVAEGQAKLKTRPRELPPPPGDPLRCVLRITIDAKGRPISAVPTSCPEPYATAARDAAVRSSWYGEGEPVQFDATYTFPPPPPRKKPLLGNG
jgi:hypothetical protein